MINSLAIMTRGDSRRLTDVPVFDRPFEHSLANHVKVIEKIVQGHHVLVTGPSIQGYTDVVPVITPNGLFGYIADAYVIINKEIENDNVQH